MAANGGDETEGKQHEGGQEVEDDDDDGGAAQRRRGRIEYERCQGEEHAEAGEDDGEDEEHGDSLDGLVGEVYAVLDRIQQANLGQVDVRGADAKVFVKQCRDVDVIYEGMVS